LSKLREKEKDMIVSIFFIFMWYDEEKYGKDDCAP